MTREQAVMLIQRFVSTRPRSLVQQMDDSTHGIGCVLRYLEETDRAVSAGEISAHMKVSTARVAVLLRNMQEKDLIVKSPDPQDARKTMVTLSTHGKESIRQKKEQFLRYFMHIAECIGEERFEEFIRISEEIHNIVDADCIADWFA